MVTTTRYYRYLSPGIKVQHQTRGGRGRCVEIEVRGQEGCKSRPVCGGDSDCVRPAANEGCGLRCRVNSKAVGVGTGRGCGQWEGLKGEDVLTVLSESCINKTNSTDSLIIVVFADLSQAVKFCPQETFFFTIVGGVLNIKATE